MFSPTGHTISSDDVDSLIARGLIDRNDQGVLSLTESGRELALKIIAETKSIEADILGQFEYWEAVLLKKLLQRLVKVTEIGLPAMWDEKQGD
jgi:DNA-binding MarR family transcriptional regulator